ncbi:MAG TPA: 50S ribosomal protein L9 [Thermodesulfobacteriota bacterium]|jgi:large subunit ribosomal protein L9|nr:50S ribosomal protein L9 [Thermodesulfobacteriota bacterium]
MKVILKEDIATLGKAGDLVEVARGYGRNYLIPHGKALEATPHHQRQLEEQKRIILKRKAKDLESAQQLAEQFESLTIEIARKVVEEGKIYGSVSSKDLMEKLAEQQIVIDRKKILLKDPIRTLGQFEVPIRLDQEVTATLKVSVIEDK